MKRKTIGIGVGVLMGVLMLVLAIDAEKCSRN